jgi:ribosomal protein RSM22 (predicted rRNA methylase)
MNLFGGSVLTQIETSSLMKEQSMKLLKAFYPHLKIETNFNETIKSLMLFGHSLNEMGAEQGLKYVLKGKPEKVLLIEPGTKESFRIGLDFREQMLKNGYVISYPCQNQNSCGLKNQTDNWCHQIVDVKHHPSIERITQIAKKDRRRLPLIIQLYEKTSTKKSETILFRVLKETKHSFEWEVCQENKIEKWQIEKKDLTKEEQKSLSLFNPGQKLTGVTVKEMDSLKRVRLVNKI